MPSRKGIPAGQHHAITQHTRKTPHIERCHNTLRQRVSHLVRATLSFSKNWWGLLGADAEYTVDALSAAHGNCPASLAGCSLAYQARLPCVEPAMYLLRTVLRELALVFAGYIY